MRITRQALLPRPSARQHEHVRLKLPASAAWVVPVTCVALLGAFGWLAEQRPRPTGLNPENLSAIPMSVAFSVVGALIVSRQPRHRLGWLYLGVGVACALTLSLFAYAWVGLVVHRGSLPLALPVGWVASWIWALTFPPAFALATLLFPDGQLPTKRWRWALAVPVAGIALDIAGAAFGPGRLSGLGTTQNPWGIAGAGGVTTALSALGWPLVVIGMMLGVASLIVRWRRAVPRSLERRQIALLALSAFVVTGAVLLPGGDSSVGSYVVDFVVVLVVPVAVGTAILRHRLYDIDVTLNRSLVYAGLTGCVLLAYAVLVAIGGQLAGADSAVSAGVAAALVAVVLLPLRRRL
jgi:hypothetical protein